MILTHTHKKRRDAFVFGEGKIYESIRLVFKMEKLSD